MTPFLVKDDVAWLGSDYRKLRAAAASLHRTTIEMSVTQGSFSDSELQELVRGLEVVSAEARQRIDDTSFAELCYQRRHVSDVIAVPVGYWAHKRSPSTLRTTPMASIEVPSTYMGRNVRPPTELGYALDSCIAFGDPESPREAEYIYEYIKEPNLYVRVLVWPPDSAGELSYPPHLDKQPCSHRECAVAGTTVHYAFGTEQYGPHEAVWRLPTYTIMLLVKPVRWTNAEWFLTLLARTVELSQHGRSA